MPHWNPNQGRCGPNVPCGLTFHLVIWKTLISSSMGHIFKKTSLWNSSGHKNPNVISYLLNGLLTLVSCDSSSIVCFTQPLVHGSSMLFPWLWFQSFVLKPIVLAQAFGFINLIYFHSFIWSLVCHRFLVHGFCLGPSALYLISLTKVFVSFFHVSFVVSLVWVYASHSNPFTI